VPVCYCKCVGGTVPPTERHHEQGENQRAMGERKQPSHNKRSVAPSATGEARCDPDTYQPHRRTGDPGGGVGSPAR